MHCGTQGTRCAVQDMFIVAQKVPTVHQDMSACQPDISQTPSHHFSKDLIIISTMKTSHLPFSLSGRNT